MDFPKFTGLFFYVRIVRGVYIFQHTSPPQVEGEFFKVDNLGEEVFQVDTKDMKKKTSCPSGEFFQPRGGGNL